MKGEVERLREQIAWMVGRCNATLGDGFSGTPNSSVAAVCAEVERLRDVLERIGYLRLPDGVTPAELAREAITR